MGLDMYVRRVNKWDKKELSTFVQKVLSSMSYAVNSEPSVFDIDTFLQTNPTVNIPYGLGEELCYWRKHPDLHGWMENLFYVKGGESDSGFNHDIVFLTKDDVLSLKSDIESKKLPQTTGFFFGSSYADEEDIKWRNEHDMKCIEDMLKALENGDSIYYSSSW